MEKIAGASGRAADSLVRQPIARKRDDSRKPSTRP
jgi:hypothetical protein